MEKVQIVKGHEPAYSLVIAMPRQALWQRVPLWPQPQIARKSFIRDRCIAFRRSNGPICSLAQSDRKDQNIGLLGSVTLHNLLDTSNRSSFMLWGFCSGWLQASQLEQPPRTVLKKDCTLVVWTCAYMTALSLRIYQQRRPVRWPEI